MTLVPWPNTLSPSLSWRKLVLRAIAEPLIAAAKWPSKLDETRARTVPGISRPSAAAD